MGSKRSNGLKRRLPARRLKARSATKFMNAMQPRQIFAPVAPVGFIRSDGTNYSPQPGARVISCHRCGQDCWGRPDIEVDRIPPENLTLICYDCYRQQYGVQLEGRRG